MAKRLDTTLQSEGAEFLVLGELLIRGIPAYKAYTRNAGYDLIATNPEQNVSARIEVKSRYASDAHWNMGTKEAGNTDFYVYVRLNRGNRYGAVHAAPNPPLFFVFPADVVDGLPKTGWGQARLKHFADLDAHNGAWSLISEFFERSDQG